MTAALHSSSADHEGQPVGGLAGRWEGGVTLSGAVALTAAPSYDSGSELSFKPAAQARRTPPWASTTCRL